MTRAAPLTAEQKKIIRDNVSKYFPADLVKMQGMEGTTTRQISDYIHTLTEYNPHAELADHIEQYIAANGLRQDCADGVMKFVKYLRGKA